MRKLLFFAFFLFLFQSCEDSNDGSDRRLEEVLPEGSSAIQDIIRNPVTANGVIDSVNVAKMDFAVDTFYFGTVKEGEVVRHEFEFTNTGTVPLLIYDARSTCGCTIPKYEKAPLEPGATSKIRVEFNTENKDGYQHKPVTLTANTYPNTTVVHLIGEVVSEKPKE